MRDVDVEELSVLRDNRGSRQLARISPLRKSQEIAAERCLRASRDDVRVDQLTDRALLKPVGGVGCLLGIAIDGERQVEASGEERGVLNRGWSHDDYPQAGTAKRVR